MSTLKVENIQHPSAASAALILDSSGNLALPAGSASTPALQGPSDTNTGLFFPTADTIAFAEGGTEALRIDSSGRVGIGTTAPGYQLDIVPDTTGTALRVRGGTSSGIIQFTNSSASAQWGYIGLTSASADIAHTAIVRFLAAGSERLRIDSSGRLLLGTSTSNSTFNSAIQIAGSSTAATQLISRFENVVDGSWLYFAKSRGTSVGTNTIVQSGDKIGSIGFYGADGSGYVTAATIAAEVDGTPGTNDMPGRLVFSTTADGASSPQERMRIDNQGRVGIGTNITPTGIGLNVYSNSTDDNSGAFTCGNANTTAAACVASFYTATNSTATSNVLIKFGINNYASGSGQINANGASAAAFGTFSDARLKENIEDLPSQWDNIKSLRPVEFDYVESFGGGHQVGFIAQEMQTVYPDAVGVGEDEMLTITAWSKTEARLVKALQEALMRIESLEAEVTALKAQ